MITLAACTARFARAWMPVLILLGASPSAFAATEALATPAPAFVCLTFTSLANSAVFVAPATTCLVAAVNTNAGIAKVENYNGATLIATEGQAPRYVDNSKGMPAVGYSLTATDDINLHLVDDESGHLVVKSVPSGTTIQETVYLDYLLSPHCARSRRT